MIPFGTLNKNKFGTVEFEFWTVRKPKWQRGAESFIKKLKIIRIKIISIEHLKSGLTFIEKGWKSPPGDHYWDIWWVFVDLFHQHWKITQTEEHGFMISRFWLVAFQPIRSQLGIEWTIIFVLMKLINSIALMK